jgi:hypothetical protein
MNKHTIRYRAECVLVSCSWVRVDTIQNLLNQGWRKLSKREGKPDDWEWIGWCPDHAKRFGVMEHFHEKSR